MDEAYPRVHSMAPHPCPRTENDQLRMAIAGVQVESCSSPPGCQRPPLQGPHRPAGASPCSALAQAQPGSPWPLCLYPRRALLRADGQVVLKDPELDGLPGASVQLQPIEAEGSRVWLGLRPRAFHTEQAPELDEGIQSLLDLLLGQRRPRSRHV